MTTQSEVILARYKGIEKEADAVGRVIGVSRLRPSQHTKVMEFTPELTGYDIAIGPDGNEIHLSHRLPLLIAAAVRLINESPISFPRSRGELDAIYDTLDVEGLAAAGQAFGRLSSADNLKTVDDAKN